MNPSVNALIVDDDRAIQRVLADALAQEGFTVTVERDGEWALKTFENKHFDVVLLDLLLPGLSGYEVARKIQQSAQGKKIPILFISGVYTTAEHRREAVEKHGAFAFLEKPVRLETLYETLRSALKDRYPERSAPPLEEVQAPSEVTAVDHLADSQAREEVTLVERTTRSVSSSRHTLRGDFKTKPFPEVLAEIFRWKGSGALLLRRDKVKKIVYFRQGRPLSVKSNVLAECLGRVLVRERMISEAECEESIRRMKASSRQQGTLLVEMGCISPHNLRYGLSLQLQSKLFDIFSWETGEFHLNQKVEPPAETVHLEESPASLIYEGVRRMFSAQRLQRVLGDVEPLYVHPAEDPLYALQELGLSEDEQRWMAEIDGLKNVGTLREFSGMSLLEFDRLLYAMRCTQIISLQPEPVQGGPRASFAPALPTDPAVKAKPAKALPPALPKYAPPVAAVPAPHPPPERTRTPVLARAAGALLPDLASSPVYSSAESLIREKLAAKVSSMRKMDFFEILEVPRSANAVQVQQAYFALARKHHPDQHFGSSSAEVQQLAQQIYDLISTAHDTLADEEERARYLQDLARGIKRPMGEEVSKMLAAEGKFQRGEELLRQRQYAAAHALFQEAVKLYDEEGEFHAYAGWSLFQAEPARAELALESLDRAVHLNPRFDRSYLFSGYIYKALGREDKAERYFEKAIQVNPDCTEALRELRLLGRARH